MRPILPSEIRVNPAHFLPGGNLTPWRRLRCGLGKTAVRFAAAAIWGLLPACAGAAPLTDDATRTVRARWVASDGLRCDRVCGERGAEAENMLVYTSDGADLYLCRVRKAPSNRFGTNYENTCKVEDSDAPGGAAQEAQFECLCVWAAR